MQMRQKKLQGQSAHDGKLDKGAQKFSHLNFM